MSKSNSKGMFERACDQWCCALIYMMRDLGRGGLNVSRVGMLMLLHTSRAMFFESGALAAFPSLQRLAFMAGLNEKTVRRALKELAKLGLINVRHRYENSNLYYLTIPASAEEHSRACLNLLTNPRNRIAQRNQLSRHPCPEDKKDNDDRSQMSGGVDNYAHQSDVNVQGQSDRHSDLHSIPKGDASHRATTDNPRDLAKEKRLSEGLEALRDELSGSPDPIFRVARERLGRKAGAVVGKAMRDWGRDAEDARAAIDEVREYDGDASDLAYSLWEPEF